MWGDSAGDVVFCLRSVERVEAGKFLKRGGVVVHAQIREGEGFPVDDKEGGGSDTGAFAAGGFARKDGSDETGGEGLLKAGGERCNHGRGDVGVGEDIAETDAVRAFGQRAHFTDVGARVVSDAAGCVDHRELAPVTVWCGGDDGVDGVLRTVATGEQFEHQRTKAGVRAVLGQRSADSGPGKRATRADRDS